MAPSALPFEPSYTALKNLRQKVDKYTSNSGLDLTLPTRPHDLLTDSNPYLDGAIGMLSDSTAFLYDDNAPWAVRVMEVKRGVERVDAKVDEVKTDVAELKMDVAELKTDVAEIKTQMKSQDKRLMTQINDVKTQVNDIKT